MSHDPSEYTDDPATTASSSTEERGGGHAATTPVVLILDHLRSAYNVGNVFRLAEAAQVEKIVTCGYTATPPHHKVAKTARGCDEYVPCEHAETASESIDHLQRQGYTVYAVEPAPESVPLWDCRLQFPAAFVLGNEALGISEKAWQACDAAVELPSYGIKNSINVANCAATILYETLRQRHTSS